MNATADRPERAGLCLTCNHASDCMHLAGLAGPVWRCEDFDDWMPAAAGHAAPGEGGTAPPAPDEIAGQEVAVEAQPRGICSNCDLYASCTFVKPEGGIWRCDEYR